MAEKRKIYPACISCPSKKGDDEKCSEGYEVWFYRKNKDNHCSKCQDCKKKEESDISAGKAPVNKEQEKEKKNKKYILYTDGGCARNPGGPGAFAAIRINKETGEEVVYFQSYISTTNNRMEMMGVIAGLENIEIGSEVELYSDSQYVISTMNGQFSKKKNLDLWKRLDKASEGKKIFPKWIRGHKGNKYNEMCDTICTENMFSRSAIPDSGYQGSANSTVCSSVSCGVEREVKKMPPGGAMAVKIDLPNNDSTIIHESVSSLCGNRKINTVCARALIRFLQSGKKTFRSYMDLKTGGLDYWSGLKGKEIVSMAGEDACSAVKEYLPEEKDVFTALRWYLRGLPLYHCIRKVLVDKEVSMNCVRG